MRARVLSARNLSLLAVWALALSSLACARPENGREEGKRKAIVNYDTAELARDRVEMVTRQIEARGVRDPRVLEAMRTVRRHLFVRPQDVSKAYADHPLPIGEKQTISQPYIVALMTEAVEVDPEDRVLEIGTGSGYQAAILGELAKEVYTIEIIQSLGERAAELLESLGYENVHVRIGDGYKGWPEQAPFDAIIVTAAPDHVPQPLIDQLADGGLLVIPVGKGHQELRLLEKRGDKVKDRWITDVLFVPMTGEAQNPSARTDQ